MATSFILCTLFVVLSIGFCSACVNPEVTSKYFSTQDATIVTNIAYISEFSVKCASGKLGNLYAELDGAVSPVAVIGPNKFQVSWTEEIKTAKSGNRNIRIFDEEGFTSYRKASRSGDDVSSVPELFAVVVNHPGAFNGPWVKSEFIATVLSLAIAYFALASRSKIVS